jgi:hypothetical protein
MKSAENLGLLVGILNKYVYFYMTGVENITSGDINKMIDLIKENIAQIKADGKVERAKEAIKYFENTISALKLKAKDNSTKFSIIKID